MVLQHQGSWGCRGQTLKVSACRGKTRKITAFIWAPDAANLTCLHNAESSVAGTGTEWDLEFPVKEVQLCLMDTKGSVS